MFQWLADNGLAAFMGTVAFLVATSALFTLIWKLYKVAKRIESVLGADEQGRTLPARVTVLEHDMEALKTGRLYGWDIRANRSIEGHTT